jgi:L-amino acid N-acyltransferase YncA
MPQTIRLTKFKDVDLNDDFFDSLKGQYKEFSDWFKRKAEEEAYVIDDDDGGLRGFIYLKTEEGSIEDVAPPLPAMRRIKVGTLKVQAKGTKLGERIIKRIFDHALIVGAKEVYVTVFDTHASLIRLFRRYGFVERGVKSTPNGKELVLLRQLHKLDGTIEGDYPLLKISEARKWLLAIYPEYHTKLFPDSILRGEDPDVEQDVSHTNTIHKVYIAKLILTRLRPGDIVVIYRTTDKPGLAKYRSVATSVCVVQEAFARKDFGSEQEFVDFALEHSVFSEAELRERYNDGEALYAVKMTYNAAFPRRPIRKVLLEDVGISVHPKWDLRPLTDEQFINIVDRGALNESIIVD